LVTPHFLERIMNLIIDPEFENLCPTLRKNAMPRRPWPRSRGRRPTAPGSIKSAWREVVPQNQEGRQASPSDL
jgi:hypothetical protein